MTGPNGVPVLLTADETADPRRSGGSAAPHRGALDEARARRDVDLPTATERRILGFDVLDVLSVGDGGYFSFHEQGLLQRSRR